MLNELIQAANALKAAGIAGETLHKELKALPKSASYKVLLAKDGSVADVQFWKEDVAGLRKWQPGGNGFSFPVFNIFPLFAPNLDETTLKALTKVEAEAWSITFQHIKAKCDDSARTWLVLNKQGNFALNDRYRKAMTDVPNQFLATLIASEMSHPVLSALVTRLKSQMPEQFFLSLTDWLADKLQHNYDAQLFSLYCSTSPAEAKKSVNILLDIPDWCDIGDHPVTSGETAKFINSLLIARDGNGDTAQAWSANSMDAYGQPAARAGEKFDDINVGGLGKIILRAMTKDAPCQYRYGKADADSFVMGQCSRRQAKIALESLADSKAKGKTWQYRSGNLVLLYPERSLPSLNELNVADFCSLPDDDDEASTQATFIARAERIAQAFDGKPSESETPIHLIVLRKPDGFRTKNVSHHFFTMSHLVESARHWVGGAKGCPPVFFARWGKEKGKREDIVPDVPFPGEVVNWLNTYWVRNGAEQGKVSTFRLEDALTLLFADDGSEKSLVTHALRHAIANWSSFLIAHGADQRSAVILKFTDKRSAPLRCLPAILSLLLYKLGYTKEHIMSSPAFLVGRLLALADSLHFQYCLAVRNGNTPPQLLGNALMQTALEMPQTALALYAQRILPYQAWAASSKVPESPKSVEGLAKWLLGQLGDTCAQVALSEIPERASDADKAQMILGYLSKTKTDEQS